MKETPEQPKEEEETFSLKRLALRRLLANRKEEGNTDALLELLMEK